MNQSATITSTVRETTGKSFGKKLRKQGQIPAVVYGHNFSPLSLSLNASEINKLFKPGSEDSQEYRLYKLVVDQHGAPLDTVVIIKEIQRHPVTNAIRHIDFFSVRMDEKIVTPVHIRVTGKAPGVKAGGVQRLILREIEVKSLPSDIPPHFDVDVSQLQIGDSIHVSDLTVPDSVQVLTDPHAAIISILAPIIHKEEVAEAAAAAAVAAEGAETGEAKQTAAESDKQK